MNGLIVINKPLNYTSMNVISVLRKATGIKQIGHAGTLDPLATGVLLVCIADATKQLRFLLDTEKEYKTTINLLAFSETDDSEGPFKKVDIKMIPEEDKIKKCITKFIGQIAQMPPKFSAIKFQGQPLCRLVKAGKEFKIGPRIVDVYSISIIDYKWPRLSLKILCGSGVYIRSLARDIGKCLETGGYVESLVRTRVGKYKIEDSVDLEDIKKDPGLVDQKIQSINLKR